MTFDPTAVAEGVLDAGMMEMGRTGQWPPILAAHAADHRPLFVLYLSSHDREQFASALCSGLTLYPDVDYMVFSATSLSAEHERIEASGYESLSDAYEDGAPWVVPSIVVHVAGSFPPVTRMARLMDGEWHAERGEGGGGSMEEAIQLAWLEREAAPPGPLTALRHEWVHQCLSVGIGVAVNALDVGAGESMN